MHKNNRNKNMSRQALEELQAIREEMKKDHPDEERINFLLNGSKYCVPMYKN